MPPPAIGEFRGTALRLVRVEWEGLLRALGKERERQQLTLAQLAERTGYDPAVLSRLFTGRQANPTLATVGRIAHALGKAVFHTLRDLPSPARVTGTAKGKNAAPRGKVSGRKRQAAGQRARSSP